MNTNTDKVFIHRLDFYWQSISVYSLAMLIYAVLRGLSNNSYFSILWKDPIIILFCFFIVVSGLSMLFDLIKQKRIIVTDKTIMFKTRFGSRIFGEDEILQIFIGKEKQVQYKKPIRIIKLHLATRKRPLRIRPTSFWDETGLTESIKSLKKNIKK